MHSLLLGLHLSVKRAQPIQVTYCLLLTVISCPLLMLILPPQPIMSGTTTRSFVPCLLLLPLFNGFLWMLIWSGVHDETCVEQAPFPIRAMPSEALLTACSECRPTSRGKETGGKTSGRKKAQTLTAADVFHPPLVRTHFSSIRISFFEQDS